MTTTLSETSMQKITESLKSAHSAFAERYPGESGRRQPVHTVYGGAHLLNPIRSSNSARSRCVRLKLSRRMRKLLPKQSVCRRKWRTRSTNEFWKKSIVKRSKISALILKTATARAPTRKKTDTPFWRRRKLRKAWKLELCRRLSAFASRLFPKNYTNEVSARSICF